MNWSRYQAFALFVLLCTPRPATAGIFKSCRDSLGELSRLLAYVKASHRAENEMHVAHRRYQRKLRSSALYTSNPYQKVLQQLDFNRRAILNQDEGNGFNRGRDLVRQISEAKIAPDSLKSSDQELALHSYIRDILEKRYQTITKNIDKQKLDTLMALIEWKKREINYYRTIEIGLKANDDAPDSERKNRLLEAETNLLKLLAEEKELTKKIQVIQSSVRIQAQRLEAIGEIWPAALKARQFYSFQFDPYRLEAGNPIFSHSPIEAPRPP